MNEKANAIIIQNLRKTFGGGDTAVQVIQDLDFNLQAGRFEAIMGPSGSGKSTLLHIIAGLIPPDEGSVKVGDREITNMSDREIAVFRRRNIGLIFQDHNLVPTLTAKENIGLPLMLDHAKDDGRVESLMESLGIAARRNHLPAKLSGGERQRVAVARALAGNPTVMLADEPTGNLDFPAAHEFCAILKKLNQETGCAILIVTHDPVIAAYAGNIHILRDGRFMDSFATNGDSALVSSRYLAAMKADQTENSRGAV